MSTPIWEGLEVAALIPCYNEEIAIPKVVGDLKKYVPGITIYVYDNNSTDRTAQLAAAAGAIVRFEPTRGKGHVVRRAFADIEADIYLMIDGDDTYGAEAAPEMIKTLIEQKLDHVLGCRIDNPLDSAHRKGHNQGNRIFNKLVSKLFGQTVTDMFSGYRVFSRRFVKSFPALSKRFEIETELTVHSMALRTPQAEVPVGFKERPAGSESKLHTFKDGFRILFLILRLFIQERPVLFYGLLALLTFATSLLFGVPVIIEYLHTGLVPRFPTAILAASLGIIGVLASMLGIVQSGILRLRRETMRLSYLSLGPGLAPLNPQTERGPRNGGGFPVLAASETEMPPRSANPQSHSDPASATPQDRR